MIKRSIRVSLHLLLRDMHAHLQQPGGDVSAAVQRGLLKPLPSNYGEVPYSVPRQASCLGGAT